MEPNRPVEVFDQVTGKLPDDVAEPFHRHRPDLFSLGLGVVGEPAPRRRQQDLERVDPAGVGRVVL
jgi:hypothetical protein